MSDTQCRNEALELGEIKNTGYEIFIAALSVLSIINLVLLYVLRDPTLDAVLYVINILLTLIFLSDFLYRFFTVESKQHYFFRNFGWADLLASLPFQQVKILRLFRLVKVGRLLEDKGAKGIARSLLRDRAGSALLSLL
ncbi:MAG: ion transporter, partial [Candidatus Nanopelagicales bacterium]|nr:ion transporter [Candidatus Nanopelagicales bacterium]